MNNQPFQLTGDTGHACLLLHGLGGGIFELRSVGEYLHTLGFGVMGINYPGHGCGSEKMPASTWDQWYDHAHDSYQLLQKDYDHISLLGFSTGCLVALRLAHNFHDDPKLTRLVMLSPFFKIKQPWYMPFAAEHLIQPASEWLEHLPRKGMPIRDLKMRELAEPMNTARTFNLRSVQSAIHLIDDVTVRLPEIERPTLVMHSRHDQVVDPSGARFLMKNLGSENKELIWLDRSNHVITLDHDRHLVFEKVGQFLQKAHHHVRV